MKKTTLCYIKKENSYLLLYRNKKENDENEGKWVGVGGKVEDGETPEECLLREVKEETGLTLLSYCFHGIIGFHSNEWGEEAMYLYSSDDFTGDLVLTCLEGTLEFVPKEKIFDLPMWEGDKCFLTPLINGEKEINMDLYYEGEKLIDIKRAR